MKLKKFPLCRQMDSKDCGPACLRMIAKYHGKNFSLSQLREYCFLNREGVSMLGISEAAEKIGFSTLCVRTDFAHLKKTNLPCIIHWDQQHFVVVYRITSKNRVYVADPALQHITYTQQEFLSHWISTQNQQKAEGVALLLNVTPNFYEQQESPKESKNYKRLFQYLKPYRSLLGQIMTGMAVGTLIGMLLPFLTQSIVDNGITRQNLHFITLVLIAELCLLTGQIGIEFIRSRILLHITTRLNISIISDFLTKLMRLPIRFFDTKLTGDLMQRIGDHKRIEAFLTSSTLSTLFSMFSLIAFSLVLAYYNLNLLLIFCLTSCCYLLWISLFLKKRRFIDQMRFIQSAKEQSNIIQLITGMTEIKLNNCEQQKRWEWEYIQNKLFKINIKGLRLSQTQQSGAFFISMFQNMLITYLTAKSVINGTMTLGMMMAVQNIIGEMNTPVHQMVSFVQSAQDAKISWERLNEIHQQKAEEESLQQSYQPVPTNKGIHIDNVSFRYNEISHFVLKDIQLRLPQGKTCAIVGMSGSGKTTLVKLILGFYPPTQGKILVGETTLGQINPKQWRKHCGTVMQDGFIFSDTIAHNIAVGEMEIDKKRLQYAAEVANIEEMVQRMPLGYNSLIGQEGNGISQGQKQRILIARAVYKNPDFLFLDEATNALDANNELIIMENLQHFFKNKTVLIVAHRLSTVKNADQIVVLHHGQMVENGTHEELVRLKGHYYNLIENQLELGS